MTLNYNLQMNFQNVLSPPETSYVLLRTYLWVHHQNIEKL